MLKDKLKDAPFVGAIASDALLRARLALLCAVIFNTGYVLFQLCLGIYHGSFWYYSLAGYHMLLIFARLWLFLYTKRHRAGENVRAELVRYRICGYYLLVLNASFGVIVFFIVRLGKTFHHHEITAIAMAACTFTAFTLSIINIVKCRKYNSPILSATKALSLVCASASMLTLETTMLTAFGGAGDEELRGLMITLTACALSAFTVTMAVMMIYSSSKKIRKTDEERTRINEQK